jgi:hypothetical protein
MAEPQHHLRPTEMRSLCFALPASSDALNLKEVNRSERDN